jgi:hypothetical protein
MVTARWKLDAKIRRDARILAGSNFRGRSHMQCQKGPIKGLCQRVAVAAAAVADSFRSTASSTGPPGVGRCGPAFQSAATASTGHGDNRTSCSAMAPTTTGPAPSIPLVPITISPASYWRATSTSISATAPCRTSEWL